MITIYGRTKPKCRYCDDAKLWCTNNGLHYEFYDISANPEYKEKLFELVPGAKTIPQIFVHGEHVGGYEDFVKHIQKDD